MTLWEQRAAAVLNSRVVSRRLADMAIPIALRLVGDEVPVSVKYEWIPTDEILDTSRTQQTNEIRIRRRDPSCCASAISLNVRDAATEFAFAPDKLLASSRPFTEE